MRTVTALGILILLSGCSANQERSSWFDLPERKLSTYVTSVTGEAFDRIGLVPTAALDYLKELAPSRGFAGYRPTKDEANLLKAYFELLPTGFQSILQRKLAAVYFIDNFDSAAMTDVVFKAPDEMYVVLYLNKSLLNDSMSDWVQFRDRSPFLDESSISIKSACSEDFKALLYALVHESSHIYDYYRHVTPYVEQFQKTVSSPATTPFVQGIWNDISSPERNFNIMEKSNYSSYGLKGKIGANYASELYMRLKASPFASLYGATSWAEDFAECFTWWFLKTQLKVEYTVSVWERGKIVVNFKPFDSELAKSRSGQLAEISRS